MEAPGKLKNRDDRKLLGTEKEKADLDGNRFIEDLKRHVSKPIAFDAIMRVRTSTGIRPTEFMGNFYMSNTTDVELATVDCDKTIGVEIRHDDKLSESEGAYVQAAILYTSTNGQRRLRVHNMAFNCCSQMADLFRSCELDTVVNILSKYAIRDTLQKSPKDVRESLMSQCSHILTCYRKSCASPSSAGQLILPEGMKLLPLYTNCIIKSNAFQGASEISTDDKSHLMFLVNAMTVKASNAFFYPRLLPLEDPLVHVEHDLENEKTSLPTALRCSSERLQESGVYILENGQQMFLWVGHNVEPKWVQDVFGVQSFAQIDIDKCQILDFDNQTSQKVRGAIKRIRDQRHRHMKLIIVRQRDKLEPLLHQFLVEDRGANGTASYVDFLCHIHKEIRSLLS